MITQDEDEVQAQFWWEVKQRPKIRGTWVHAHRGSHQMWLGISRGFSEGNNMRK